MKNKKISIGKSAPTLMAKIATNIKPQKIYHVLEGAALLLAHLLMR